MKWNELHEWQKHAIVLTTILLGGFFIIRSLAKMGHIDTVDETSWNVILNLVALAYAVFAYYLYDKQAELVRQQFIDMNIQPPNWQGLAIYLTENLKPLFDAWKDSGIEPEDMKKMLKKVKSMSDKTITAVGSENFDRILNDIEEE